jgi:hypothetical protein
MTGQLDRVHALLAAGNVPCEMKRRPDGERVLAAGTPTSTSWEVLLWVADGDLFVQHKGTIDRLPTDDTDQAIADAIKFRVVESWADQGDPQAKALMSVIARRYPETPAGRRGSGAAGDTARSGRTRSPQPAMRSVTAQLSPWGFALRITDSRAGDGIPTSWAWQWGLGPGAVTDYYQRFFSAVRAGAMGVLGNEKP